MDAWNGVRGLPTLSDRLACLRLATEQSGRDMTESLRRHGQLTCVLCCRVAGTDVVEVADGFYAESPTMRSVVGPRPPLADGVVRQLRIVGAGSERL